jgi:thiamine biosynthesis lipoprotein
MGTVAEFAVVASRRDGHAAIDGAFAELSRVDACMSRFRPDSEIGRLNAGRRATLSTPTRQVLETALVWAHGTDGAFDPCVGQAVRLWDVTHRTAPPAAEESRRFADRRLYRSLELSGAQARLRNPLAAVDLGGIAKGYAVDRAVEALRRRGIRAGLVNVGGDLYALGRSEDGDRWRIGIRGLATTIEVEDAAVATSGDYERGFEHQGRRYHHLLDPRTGAPHRSRRNSLTVRAASCMAADAAATALFGMARREADSALRTLDPAARIVV